MSASPTFPLSHQKHLWLQKLAYRMVFSCWFVSSREFVIKNWNRQTCGAWPQRRKNGKINRFIAQSLCKWNVNFINFLSSYCGLQPLTHIYCSGTSQHLFHVSFATAFGCQSFTDSFLIWHLRSSVPLTFHMKRARQRQERKFASFVFVAAIKCINSALSEVE